MSIKQLDDYGAANLVEAIVRRAAVDYLKTKPGGESEKEIEGFFLSDYFETLTGKNGG